MDILEAQTEIVSGLLNFLDWRGGAAPYIVSLRDRKEGHPRFWFGRDISYPLACVELSGSTAASPVGQQQEITSRATVNYILEIADGRYPSEEIRKNIGRIVENILGSSELGKAWIADLVWLGSEMRDNEFEQHLRRNSIGYTCGEATFNVTYYYDR